MNITEILACREPIIKLVTCEEQRAIADIHGAAGSRPVYSWSCTAGIVRHGDIQTAADDRAITIAAAHEYITRKAESLVFVFKDAHRFLLDQGSQGAAAVRLLRDLNQQLLAQAVAGMIRKKVILLGPSAGLPPELEREIKEITYPLPSRAEIRQRLEQHFDGIEQRLAGRQFECTIPREQFPEFIAQLGESMAGLTTVEIDNLINNLLEVERRLDRTAAFRRINREKATIFRASGVLEFVTTSAADFSQVGGLDLLKATCRIKRDLFLVPEEANNYGIHKLPRGILMLGLPGCGKSLAAKAIASEFGVPLVRVDIGAVHSKYLGESEGRLREAIAVLEAAAPVVAWFDELEKGFADRGSDSTTPRLMGMLLTWLQETRAPIFLAATANDIAMLRPELLRTGRFDRIFYVDLPAADERRDILAIHLRLAGRDPDRFDLDRVAGQTENFSGAELEQAVREALERKYAAARAAGRVPTPNAAGDIGTADLLAAGAEIRPLALTMREQLDHIQLLARQGRIFPASSRTALAVAGG